MRGRWQKRSHGGTPVLKQAGWLMFILCVIIARPLHPQSNRSEETLMHHYVLIFRPTRTLTADEVKQRGVEIPAWVKRVNAMGITIDPKALSASAVRFSQQNGNVVKQEGSADPTLTNLVFFDAAGEEQALEVARIHPGLHYGVNVEVREWTFPAAGPAAAQK